eukprot:3654604-Rhodomonas_salina.2
MEGGVQSCSKQNGRNGQEDPLWDATNQGDAVGDRNGRSRCLLIHCSYFGGETQDDRRDHQAMVECTSGCHRDPQLCIAHPAMHTTPTRRMADHTCKGDHVGGDGVLGAPARG